MKTYHLDIYKNIHTHKEKGQAAVHLNVTVLFSRDRIMAGFCYVCVLNKHMLNYIFCCLRLT